MGPLVNYCRYLLLHLSPSSLSSSSRAITASPSLLGRRLRPGRRGGAGRRRAPVPAATRTTSYYTAAWELVGGSEGSANMAAAAAARLGSSQPWGRRRLRIGQQGGVGELGWR